MAAGAHAELPLYRFRSFEALPGVVHGVTTRHGGVSRGAWSTLNLSISVQDDEAAVRENRRRVAAELGFSDGVLVTTRQVHGARVALVDQEHWSSEQSPKADALITASTEAALLQRFADCVPIFLASTKRPAVGLAHAGWRGTVANVAGATVKALQDTFGIAPGDLIAGIGPSIGPCCFEVGTEVAEHFASTPQVILQGQSKPHVDLWEANRLALIQAGLGHEAIEVANVCTRCHADTFFSHRAMGYPAGRFGGVIGLRS